MEIIAANLRGQTRRFTLKQLLPEAFRLDPDRPRSR
jgi:cytidine deaminase